MQEDWKKHVIAKNHNAWRNIASVLIQGSNVDSSVGVKDALMPKNRQISDCFNLFYYYDRIRFK